MPTFFCYSFTALAAIMVKNVLMQPSEGGSVRTWIDSSGEPLCILLCAIKFKSIPQHHTIPSQWHINSVVLQWFYQQEHNLKPFPGLLNAAKCKITFFPLCDYNHNVYQINLKLLLALWWTLIWSLPKPVSEKPFLLQKGFWEDTSRLDEVIYFVEVCLS